MADSANPPFATKDGKPANQGKGGDGGRDFVTDYVDSEGGGPGMIAKDRPQSEAKPEVTPNPQEIPPGGVWGALDAIKGPGADPTDGAQASGVKGAKMPMKGLR